MGNQMIVNSCICTKEFEENVQKVCKRDYSIIDEILSKEIKCSLSKLRLKLKLQLKYNKEK